MLKQPKFNGSTIVANKGTDIVIVTARDALPQCMVVSKKLGVVGISTAVLVVEKSGTVDPEALRYYAKLTKAILFISTSIFEIVSNQMNLEAVFRVLKESSIQEIEKTARELIREKSKKKNEGGGASGIK